ncbi:MAG: DMT family transporter [Victivallales bacterium]|nr:DMT family transporter [Victivallales bacterium]
MNRLQANICLICVTLYWSLEVILYTCIPSEVPPFATSCVTSLAGSLLLFGAFHRRTITECRQHGRPFILRCLFYSILSAAFNTMFLYGLKSFDVASGAFTVCMTVVVLPVVLLSVRRCVSKETWVSVLLVLSGIMLALTPTLHGTQLPGLLLMGGGCLIRAIFIILLTDLAKKYDPMSIAILLEGFAGFFSLVAWFIVEPRLFFALPVSRTLVAAWAIYSYFIVAIAHALNFFALKHVTATNATVVYSLEIVFSIIWGAVLPDNLIEKVPLTPTIVLGTVLVTIGSLTEILDIRGRRRLHDVCKKEEIT